MAISAEQTIEADIPYLATMRERPLSYSGFPDRENLEIDWKKMPIRDARGNGVGPTLMEHGFAVAPQKSAVSQFDLTDSWHKTFKAEIIQAVKSATGAVEVIVPAVSYRKVDMAGSFGAASFCHNDYTAGSAARHIVGLEPERAESLLSGRFAAYNIWKLISPPPQTMPLALCDARSVLTRDLIPGEAHFGDPAAPTVWGEIATFRHNPDHRWCYFPDLRNDEMLIWCGFDSDPAFASIVPHTAFKDPSCPTTAPARTNIDARCYAFFE